MACNTRTVLVAGCVDLVGLALPVRCGLRVHKHNHAGEDQAVTIRSGKQLLGDHAFEHAAAGSHLRRWRAGKRENAFDGFRRPRCNVERHQCPFSAAVSAMSIVSVSAFRD